MTAEDKPGWTDERVKLLITLWAGSLSPTEIAATLGGGITRNAVIGKIHRLGLSGRSKNEIVHATTILADKPGIGKARQLRLASRRHDAGHATTPSTRQPAPPRLAEFCLKMLLSEAKAEAAAGCLIEPFQQEAEQYGLRGAQLLYWKRTMQSLWPLLRRALARLIKLGVFVEAVRRWFFTG